jgi:DNA-binding MarR family transcriptional regulator
VRRRATRANPPLARLFAIAYRQLTDDLHDQLQNEGWRDVRPAFGFVLVAARERPTSVAEVASLTGVTKQAASKLVDMMARSGYVQRAVNADDRRQHPVALTARGRALLEAVEQSYTDLETEWAKIIGAQQLEHMRQNLIRVVSSADGQLPPVRSPTQDGVR